MRLLFVEYHLLLPYLLFVFSAWFIFFKANYYSVSKRSASIDKIRVRSLFRFIDNRLFVHYTLVMLAVIVLNFLIIRGDFFFFWWQHLYVSSVLTNMLLLVVCFKLLGLLVILGYPANYKKVNYNFFFALANLSVLMPLLFFANTFFTFFFLLELLSLLVFYKLSASRFISYTNTVESLSTKLKQTKLLARGYINMLFFSYWTTFFSSVIFVYSLVVLTFYFGASEWCLINHLLRNSTLFTIYEYKNALYLLTISITLAFFLKTGLTPLHFYKIELYKGIPYIAIFFYNTIYFLFYFIFFTFLIFFHLNELYILYNSLNTYLFFIATAYIISLLFNLNYIKAFFAYSTVINSLMFLFIAFSVLI